MEFEGRFKPQKEIDPIIEEQAAGADLINLQPNEASEHRISKVPRLTDKNIILDLDVEIPGENVFETMARLRRELPYATNESLDLRLK